MFKQIEQAIDLPHRSVDAPFEQLLAQQRLGDVTVMVLVEQVGGRNHAILMNRDVRRFAPLLDAF